MHRPRGLSLAVILLATALSLTACGGDEEPAGETSSPAATESAVSEDTPTTAEGTLPVEPTTEASEPTESEREDDAVEVEVTIEGGEITPLGETVEAAPGQEIRVVVDSDAHDEFHVHSDPEHELVIEEGRDQVFTFSIEDPAVYEMESHELGVVIVKFQIS